MVEGKPGKEDLTRHSDRLNDFSFLSKVPFGNPSKQHGTWGQLINGAGPESTEDTVSSGCQMWYFMTSDERTIYI